MANRIRLMTHNVWNCDNNAPAWEAKGEDCSALARIDGLVRVYKETQPDIIGGQEVSHLMEDLLVTHCAEAGLNYTLIYGRYTPILYRADKFELLDSLFFTYPETIDGFEGAFNDVRSKAMSLGVFREKESGKTFIFVTTHLWWRSEKPEDIGTDSYQAHSDAARTHQIGLLLERVKTFYEKYHCPVFVVGDLNTDYCSEAVSLLFKNGFRHAHDIATEFAEESVGYHYCFPAGYEKYYYDRPFEKAIDHIVVMGEKDGAVKRFERYSPDWYLPISDHSPAFVDVEL